MYDVLGAFTHRATQVEKTLAPGSLRHSLYQRVISSMDPKRVYKAQNDFRARLARFAFGEPGVDKAGPEKYFDIPLFVADRLDTALSLNLAGSSSKRILDIGSGPGHFGAICNALGHEVLGIDVEHELYVRLCEVMDVKTKVCPVRRLNRLPDLGTKFDLVTAIWICFDVVGSDEAGRPTYWGLSDWQFFVEDLFSNHVTDSGAIYLSLNLHSALDGGKEYNPELLNWAAARGAAVDEQLGTVYWLKREYLRDGRVDALASRAQAVGDSKLETLFFTYANTRYEHYVLPYIYSVLFHNRDAAVEICLDSAEAFRANNQAGIEIIDQCFGCSRIRLRDTVFAKSHRVRPQSVRNLETPTLMLPYTYIGDIDILILEGDITAQHMRNMEQIDLPYSNTYRKVQIGNRDALSGLHFTRTDAYYPQIDVSHLNLMELSNQDLIYRLAVGKVGKAPPGSARFRPWHGLHVSERLNFYMADPAGRQFGLNDAKACKAYLAMRESSGWQRLLQCFAPEYKAILALMDSALQRLHPEWRVLHSISATGSSPAAQIVPGPLRAYPYQAYINGLRDFIDRTGVKSVVDLGCGDPLMTLFGLGGVDFYVGIDDDPECVASNLECYRHPKYLFKRSDITVIDPPAADFILARDTLNGLKLESIDGLVDRIMRSGGKYLGITHYSEHADVPMSVGGYHVINWEHPPFNFSEPDFLFRDSIGEFIPDFIGGQETMNPAPAEWATRKDRHIAVWVLSRLCPGRASHTNPPKRSAKDYFVLEGSFSRTGDVGWYCSLPLSVHWVGDNEKYPKQSRVVVLEDGKALGPAHALHEVVGKKGFGSYSHWGATVYFSASDNSDPNTNGRTYALTTRDSLNKSLIVSQLRQIGELPDVGG